MWTQLQALGDGDAPSSELLQSLLDASQDCLRVLDLEGRVRFINRSGLAQIDVEDFRALEGSLWREQWPEDARPLIDAALQSALAGAPRMFRAHCRSHNGAAIWWDTTISPMRRRNGEIACLLAVSRDVTISAEAQTFYDTLVHLLPTPLLVKDAADGRYVLINQAAEEAFGLHSAEMLGKTARNLFGEEHGATAEAEDREVIESRAVKVSAEEPTPTRGGLRYFTTRKRATFDETGPLHIVTVGEDVSERRQALEELRLAVEAAERANAAKGAFLANMSHEIRTPMNGIVAGADMLARCKLDAEAQRLVEIIRTSGHTLNALLSDILDLARIEAGQLSLESKPFQLGDLVRGAADLARLRADERGVELHTLIAEPVDSWVLGDATRIRQVLMNLLGNAVKFTERGRIEVAAEPVGGDRIRIMVRDSGIGFDPEFKRRLFERFQQADESITRRFGGSGLGMAISRDLVSCMGGELDCESEPGVGSTFWFELSLPKADSSDREIAGVEDFGADARLQILAADDHPTNRQVLELMLKDACDLTVVENGAQALLAYEAGRFDLVLMDMQMPVMDGLEATRRIRRSELGRSAPRTPIIMLTANALPEHIALSLDAGADRHVEKPITLTRLLSAMAELLTMDPASATKEAKRGVAH